MASNYIIIPPQSGGGGGGGSPGGSTNSIQINAGSSMFGGDSNFTYDGGGGFTTYTGNGLAATVPTSAKGFLFQNLTASTNAVPVQISPPQYFTGRGFRTSPAADFLCGYRMYVLPIANTSSSTIVNSQLNIDALTQTGSSLSGSWTTLGFWHLDANSTPGLTINGTCKMSQFLATGSGNFNSTVAFNSTSTFFGNATFISGMTGVSASFSSTVSANTFSAPFGVLTHVSSTEVISAATYVTTGTPSAPSLSLVAAPVPSAPSLNAAQYTPHIGVTTWNSITQNNGGSGYTADGSTYQFDIVAFNNDGSIGRVVSSNTVTDDNSSSAFEWDLSWNAVTTSLDTLSGYWLQRIINGGAPDYLQILDPNATSFQDTNTGWNSSPAFGPAVPDYLATSMAHNYQAALYFPNGSPSGGTYFGASFSYSFTDDNSGNPYTVLHTGLNGSLTRVLGDNAGSTSEHYDTTASQFVEDQNLWSAGNALSPNGYGIIADGTNLGGSLSFYGSQMAGMVTIYSAGSVSASSSDPNDSNPYAIQVNYTTGSGNDHIKVFPGGIGFFAGTPNSVSFVSSGPSGTFYLDATTVASGSSTVTPTQTAGIAGLFSSPASSIAEQGQVEIKNSTGYYTRLDFLDFTGTRTAYLESNGSAVSLVSPSSLLLQSATSFTSIQSGSNFLSVSPNNDIQANTNIWVATVGKGYRVAEGSNAKQGIATLVAGTVVVSNTSVTANSRIFLTAQDANSTGSLRVSARTASTSFTITSSNGADHGVIAYEIFEPV